MRFLSFSGVDTDDCPNSRSPREEKKMRGRRKGSVEDEGEAKGECGRFSGEKGLGC